MVDLAKGLKYGLREDGTPKGAGFFGELKRPDGDISTELSQDSEFNGKKLLYPLLVPTLNRQEINHLLMDGDLRNELGRRISDKAYEHAVNRVKAGRSQWAEDGEIYPAPK